MVTYYEYNDTFFFWSGISTENTGYATSEYVPVSVGAGLTQTWTGSGWSTTTDYRGTYYHTTDTSGHDLGDSLIWVNATNAPAISIATATAPPTISTTGYVLGWDGSDWTVTANSIIPEGDGVVSLGSPTNKWKDLYVSEGTVYLGVHSLSVSSNNLEYDGEQIITGVAGTINTDYADISSVNAGVITATQIGAANSGILDLDGDFVPTHNRTFDLGKALKSWNKVYVKNGPKAIEFGNTNIGIGFTINAQGDNILEFDGHELFAGDGDIGHHGNLNNIYAAGIVSATVGAQVGVLTANTITSSGTQDLFVRTDLVPSADDTYELGSVSNRWKDIYLDGGEQVLNIGDVAIGVTDGHLVVDGREALDLDSQGDLGVAGRLRNVYLTGIVTGYNAGIVTYYGDGTNLDLPVTSGGGGAIATKYKSSSTTTMSDPGKGKWRLNNLTQSNATQMAVDVTTSGGYNINSILSQITAGTKIFLQRKDSPQAYFTFIVNTAPTLQGTTTDGWYLFSSITNLRNGGTGISDNKDCVLAFKAPNQVSGESITPSSVALGDGGPSWTNGTGSPEGVVTAPVGSLYSRTDGGTGTTLYVKESGTGNTGWVAK